MEQRQPDWMPVASLTTSKLGVSYLQLDKYRPVLRLVPRGNVVIEARTEASDRRARIAEVPPAESLVVRDLRSIDELQAARAIR